MWDPKCFHYVVNMYLQSEVVGTGTCRREYGFMNGGYDERLGGEEFMGKCGFYFFPMS